MANDDDDDDGCWLMAEDDWGGLRRMWNTVVQVRVNNVGQVSFNKKFGRVHWVSLFSSNNNCNNIITITGALQSFLCFAGGGHGFEFCVYVAGWRHASSEWGAYSDLFYLYDSVKI